MPEYSYSHPETGETITVFQSVHDDHIFIDKAGTMWKRVWTVPNAAIDAKLDPNSRSDFLRYTGTRKGKLKDLQNLSAEMSEARAAKNGGRDPVREAFYSDYEKKTRGKPHIDKSRREAQEKLKKKGFEVSWD